MWFQACTYMLTKFHQNQNKLDSTPIKIHHYSITILTFKIVQKVVGKKLPHFAMPDIMIWASMGIPSYCHNRWQPRICPNFGGYSNVWVIF